MSESSMHKLCLNRPCMNCKVIKEKESCQLEDLKDGSKQKSVAFMAYDFAHLMMLQFQN